MDKAEQELRMLLIPSLKGMILSLEFIRDAKDAPQRAESIISKQSDHLIALFNQYLEKMGAYKLVEISSSEDNAKYEQVPLRFELIENIE